MLRNDPPPGTKVRFTRQIREAKFHDTAKLVSEMQKFTEDRPDDEFVVEFREERMTVQRRDIEEAE